ncbi:MAG: hypothetical protein II586_09525, partial [Butyrivibrio sp.]|nr:hypothetical protein [Butyrivibrio sp.]
MTFLVESNEKGHMNSVYVDGETKGCMTFYVENYQKGHVDCGNRSTLFKYRFGEISMDIRLDAIIKKYKRDKREFT